MFRTFGLITTFCVIASPVSAEVRTVRPGDNLQAVLNVAQPGDEIRLAADATFSGNFVLPVTNGTSTITLRTDLPDTSLPGISQRVNPAAAAHFARIVSPNTTAALRTAPGAHHWRVLCVQFFANKEGYGDIVQLGDGSGAQSTLDQVPYELVFDRVYIQGHPLYGQKRGIALNARTVTIRNSYIENIKAAGADAQAIGGWNGPGPFSIENNYLEASGEVLMLGGADPKIPNLVTEDVLVRYNHVSRPMSWRDPVIPAPSAGSAADAAGGSLPAGTYSYRVVACRLVGQGNVGNSLPSSELTAVSSGGAVSLTWSAVPDATEYRIYGRTSGSASQFWTVPGTSFTDTGAAGASGAVPEDGTRWEVKNLLELKNARRVKVQYNLFENHWKAAQPGYAIVFTPRNQDGGCPWCVVESVDFSHNIVRNVAAGINILGYDSNKSSQQTSGIIIFDNLFSGVTTALGGNAWGVLMGDEPRDVTFDHNTFDVNGTTVLYVYGEAAGSTRPVAGFRFTNNAAQHGTYGVNGASASTGTLTIQMYFPDSVITGNWLSGGPAARYPSGNRFDTPFDRALAPWTAVLPLAPADPLAPGADISRLRPLLDSLIRGLMPTPPLAPLNLRITAPR